MEHIVFTATILGLYLGFDAVSEYKMGWWGFVGILCLLLFTLPHLQLTAGTTYVDEFRLGIKHAGRPEGEPERKTLEFLEEDAKALGEENAKIGKRYSMARNFFWFIGFPLAIALGVLEWFI